jgi:DNA helicase-2/ATP-dependent DNA helicase PcrA
MIDEYQDTNPAQYIWARMLVCSHQNICCVGDDDQSIYSWRGADVTNILRFETDFPNAKLIKLEQNYRSTSQILAASSTLIQNNKARHNKTLWTSATGDPISIVSCYNDKIEAKFVVLQIRRAMVANIPDQTIAILVRAGFQTRLFEEELIFGCIAYTVVGGIKFYERMEIKDIIAYVRLAVNINDSLAFERIINVPKRAIGNVTLGHIKSFAIDNNCSLFSATEQMLKTGKFSAKTHNTLQLFVDQVISWNNCIKEHQPSKFAKKILEESGYRQMLLLEKTDESRARLDNIRELLSNMIEFENIDQFLEHASLVSNNDSNAIETPIVQLMTVHSAKGLEFDIVFMPGMEEGLFPHQKSLNEGHKALEEERRIAYVGITRAKKKLIMSYAENRFMFYEKVSFLPSRFISELPKDCYVFQKASSAYK